MGDLDIVLLMGIEFWSPGPWTVTLLTELNGLTE
jgi:hypothetical protein